MHEGTALTKQFKHSTVSNTQAASAAIRLMEGDVTNLVRAAERFVAQSRVLSGVLKTAFPVIGAVAIAGVIGEGVKKIVQFIEKANKVPQALQNAFQSANLSITSSNDALQKSNDELRNQIALLEHKPVNNAAIAIDDARLAADKLAKSLEEDNKQIQALLKDNSLSMLAGMFTHQGRTAGTSGLVQYWANELQQRGNAVVIAQHQYGVGSAQDKAAQAALAQRQKDAEASVQRQLALLQQMQTHHVAGFRSGGSGATADQSANIDIAQGYLAQLYGRDNEASLQNTNASLQAKKQALTHAKELAGEEKQLQLKQVETWKNNLVGLQAIRALSVNDEANYWIKMASTVKNGSLAQQKALQEANRLISQQVRQEAQERDKWKAAGLTPDQTFTDSQGMTQSGTWKNSATDLSKDTDAMKLLSEQGRAVTQWLSNLNRASDIQQANADALAEQSLQMAIATGHISRMDAAQVQARLHTQEYTDALKQLEDARKAVLGRSDLSPLDKNAQTSALDNQIAILNGSRDLQTQQDDAAIQAATTMGQLRNAAAQLATQFNDLGSQLSGLFAGAIDSTNQSLASALMAHTYNGYEYRRNIVNAMSGQLRQFGSGGLNIAFQHLEGGLLGKFGMGKPDGSKSRPLYVQFANGPTDISKTIGATGHQITNTVQSTSRGLLGMMNDSNFFGKLFGGSLFGAGGLFDGGHFAGGGAVKAGVPINVGELGPERFVPYTNGRIIPNNELRANSGPTHIAYIDATGSADPEAVTRQVHAAMQAYGPYAVSASVSAVDEQRKRIPLSKR